MLALLRLLVRRHCRWRDRLSAFWQQPWNCNIDIVASLEWINAACSLILPRGSGWISSLSGHPIRLLSIVV
jgi:hypothetical protein